MLFYEERVRELNFNTGICFSIRSVKMCAFLGFFIVSEQDGLSGHRDFPWMQLHCNFQGLVAEPNSDRNILATSVAVSEQHRVCVLHAVEQLL